MGRRLGAWVLFALTALLLASCSTRSASSCVEDHGAVADIEQEANYSSDSVERWGYEDGCDVRLDVVMTRVNGCAGVSEILLGWPPVRVSNEENNRIFVKDPRNRARDKDVAESFETLDELPDDATDTGLRHEGQELWVDEMDDSSVYVVSGGLIQSWPHDENRIVCD